MPTDTPYDLSIITVCRNVRDSISKTVDSVLAQKAKKSIRIEHVFVDGASTDGSRGLLEELLQAGKIERYISEPDTGIYDGMNKGIRLARGKVLFFLNSDDILINATDLADMVRPIVAGECDVTCGQWSLSDSPHELLEPSFYLHYTVTPCCHQAFFMSKAWYEKLGLYDQDSFRCAADTNMMWASYAAGARMRHIQQPVIVFQVGGFSLNSHDKFLNEAILITYRHKEEIAKLVREEQEYLQFLTLYLITNIFIYPGFLQRGGKDAAATAQRLAELGAIVAAVPGHGLDRLILKLIAGPCLRAFAAGKSGKLRQSLWRIPCLFLSWPKDKRYTTGCWQLPLKARICKRLS